MSAKDPDHDQPTLSFEDASSRLEEIVQELEEGELPLEQLVLRYEEGMKMVTQCSHALNRAEKRIEAIQKLHQGEVEIVPADDIVAAPAGSGSAMQDRDAGGMDDSPAASSPAKRRKSKVTNSSEAGKDDTPGLSLF